MSRKKITYDDQYKGLPINTNKEKNQGCYVHILETSFKIMECIVNKHGKVLCTRFDLRYPKDFPYACRDKHISAFISKYIKYFKRKGIDVRYHWVEEKTFQSKHPHYHLAIFANGNKVKSSKGLTIVAGKIWGETLKSTQKGLVDYCNKSKTIKDPYNSYVLKRGKEGFEETRDAWFKRVSYMAKVHTKGSGPKGMRESGSSRIPKVKKGPLKAV